jgi:hypothetical protein
VILGDTSRVIDRYKHLFDGHEEALIGRLDALYRRTTVSDPSHDAQTSPLDRAANDSKKGR